MGLDVNSIRSEFPILNRKLPNGKKLVYFDNAATSQKPQCVIDAMSRYYEEYNSNAHRANHTLADEATSALENARRTISSYFGTSPEQLIYTSGATEAINLVASPIAIGRTPVTDGSNVPPCPTFLIPNTLRSLLTQS